VAAQEGRGTITGRLTDETGAVIAGVEVRVTNRETGATVGVRSNDTGHYTIPYLLPGSYDLAAEIAGFKKVERQRIEVRVGDVLSLDVSLQLGDRAESVNVRAAVPLLESATVSLGQVVDQRRLTELPIQAGNAEELVLLTSRPARHRSTTRLPSSAPMAAHSFRTNSRSMVCRIRSRWVATLWLRFSLRRRL
jgi:hypothetical protein